MKNTLFSGLAVIFQVLSGCFPGSDFLPVASWIIKVDMYTTRTENIMVIPVGPKILELCLY